MVNVGRSAIALCQEWTGRMRSPDLVWTELNFCETQIFCCGDRFGMMGFVSSTHLARRWRSH
ncbi:MAG: hypothetical protein WCD53_01350 [Microcoleus sp.]